VRSGFILAYRPPKTLEAAVTPLREAAYARFGEPSAYALPTAIPLFVLGHSFPPPERIPVRALDIELSGVSLCRDWLVVEVAERARIEAFADALMSELQLDPAGEDPAEDWPAASLGATSGARLPSLPLQCGIPLVRIEHGSVAHAREEAQRLAEQLREAAQRRTGAGYLTLFRIELGSGEAEGGSTEGAPEEGALDEVATEAAGAEKGASDEATLEGIAPEAIATSWSSCTSYGIWERRIPRRPRRARQAPKGAAHPGDAKPNEAAEPSNDG